MKALFGNIYSEKVGDGEEVVIKVLEMLFSKCHFARSDSKYFNGSTQKGSAPIFDVSSAAALPRARNVNGYLWYVNVLLNVNAR